MEFNISISIDIDVHADIDSNINININTHIDVISKYIHTLKSPLNNWIIGSAYIWNNLNIFHKRNKNKIVLITEIFLKAKLSIIKPLLIIEFM